jgi:uncharacterized membrane protein YfcA
VTAIEAALIIAAGFAAGIVNTLAGGGSLLTVPLLVLIGVPGTFANGTNRIAVLAQSIVGAWRFRAEGVSGFRHVLPVLAPMLVGATVGAYGVAHLDDASFERLFGIVMLVLLVPALFPPRISAARVGRVPMRPVVSALTFFAIGLYGGAFQAGVGLFLVLALARAGHDLVMSNSVKMVAVAAFTTIAAAIFVYEGQVYWMPAIALSVGTGFGAALGARIAVRGGERLIRRVLVVAVVALAGRMLGLY